MITNPVLIRIDFSSKSNFITSPLMDSGQWLGNYLACFSLGNTVHFQLTSLLFIFRQVFGDYFYFWNLTALSGIVDTFLIFLPGLRAIFLLHPDRRLPSSRCPPVWHSSFYKLWVLKVPAVVRFKDHRTLEMVTEIYRLKRGLCQNSVSTTQQQEKRCLSLAS